MDRKTLNTTLSVSAQIFPDDIAALKTLGIRTLICNRPDGEAADQPAYTDIEQHATAQGLHCVFMPVVSGHISADNIKQFTQALTTLPTPIHAYCRSGTRCTHLWGLSEALQGRDRQQIIQQAADAGYDLSRVI